MKAKIQGTKDAPKPKDVPNHIGDMCRKWRTHLVDLIARLEKYPDLKKDVDKMREDVKECDRMIAETEGK